MKIIVHYPNSEEELSELGKKTADLHIEAITSYLDKLFCPKEQKIQIINKLKEKSEPL